MRCFAALLLAALGAGCGPGPAKEPPSLLDDSAAQKQFLDRSLLSDSNLTPYVRGKVAVLSVDDGGIVRAIQELLPDKLRARHRGEVETVVWLQKTTEKIDGLEYRVQNRVVPGYSTCYDVTVIDWADKKRLGGPRIAGPRPPASVMVRVEVDQAVGGIVGPRPVKEIVDYLEGAASSVAVPPLPARDPGTSGARP